MMFPLYVLTLQVGDLSLESGEVLVHVVLALQGDLVGGGGADRGGNSCSSKSFNMVMSSGEYKLFI